MQGNKLEENCEKKNTEKPPIELFGLAIRAKTNQQPNNNNKNRR